MSVISPLYGTSNQSISCTLISLANAAQQCSAAISNTSTLYLEAMVSIGVATGNSGTAATGTVNVYAYGTVNGGTNYSDAVPGTNSSVTLTSPPNARLIGVLNAVANGTSYIGGPWSVAAAFGGNLPDHWGIIVENKTGATLGTSTGSAWFQGINQSVV